MGLHFDAITRGPPVLVLSHYPLRLHTWACACRSMKKTHTQYFGTGPSLHTVIVPLIKSCPQIPHLCSQVCTIGRKHAPTLTHEQIVHVILGFFSLSHPCAHTCPASNTSDLTFPSEFHCSWHGLFSHVGCAASEPTFLGSDTSNFCPPPLWTAWALCCVCDMCVA